mgnify:CR=1 FL=1
MNAVERMKAAAEAAKGTIFENGMRMQATALEALPERLHDTAIESLKHAVIEVEKDAAYRLRWARARFACTAMSDAAAVRLSAGLKEYVNGIGRIKEALS